MHVIASRADITERARHAALPTELTLMAGISAPAASDNLPAARQEADECLALHETRHSSSVPPAYEESWDRILLQRLRTAAQSGRAPARGPVTELRLHDTETAPSTSPHCERGCRLKETLEKQADNSASTRTPSATGYVR